MTEIEPYFLTPADSREPSDTELTLLIQQEIIKLLSLLTEIIIFMNYVKRKFFKNSRVVVINSFILQLGVHRISL